MATPKELLLAMGLDPDEAVEADKELSNKQRGDRRICLCGHSVGRHTEISGRPSCQVGKQFCPCRRIQPVLLTNDTRSFIRKTEGSGLMHALTRGLAGAVEKNLDIEWLEDERYCHKCKTQEPDMRLTPMSVSSNGTPQSLATGYDALFCDNCRVGK